MKTLKIEKYEQREQVTEQQAKRNATKEIKQTQIKTTSAIRLNNYKNNILFHLAKGLYVGIKEDYDNKGTYDNSHNTLKKITDNEKLYALLSGEYSHIALAGFIASGKYSLEDITEFYEIAKKLNIKYYDFMSEKDNKEMYKINLKEKIKNEKL